jgi:hypothetical protein
LTKAISILLSIVVGLPVEGVSLRASDSHPGAKEAGREILTRNMRGQEPCLATTLARVSTLNEEPLPRFDSARAIGVQSQA